MVVRRRPRWKTAEGAADEINQPKSDEEEAMQADGQPGKQVDTAFPLEVCFACLVPQEFI